MKRSEATKLLSKIISPTYYKISDLESLISSPTTDWEEIISVANRYQVVPNLYLRLKEKNLLKLLDDPQLVGYIKEIYKLNSFRNSSILEQLNEICELLYRELSINVVLLKGVSALSESHFKALGERVMLDIDILVPENRIFEAINLLKDNGYSEITTTELYKGWHHYNRLYHPNKMTSVELHRYPLGNNSPFPKQLTSEHLIKSQTIPNAYVLDLTYELIHSFLHTQLSHNYHKTYFVSLRHLHHFSVMLTHFSEEIDHRLIDKFMQKNGLSNIWNEYLYVVNQLFVLNNSEVLKNKGNEAYFQKLLTFLDNSNSIRLKLFFIKNKIEHMLSHENLNKHYGIENSFQRYLYIPVHILYAIRKLLLSKKDREGVFQSMGNLLHR